MPDIWNDTRQKHGKHVNIDSWFDSHGVTYEYKKLDFGDYMRADGLSNISVDTKQGLDEVAQNVGRDHGRFAREMDRARAAGYRLCILIEAGARYRTLADVAKWTSGVCLRCPRRRAGDCAPRRDRCGRFHAKPLQGERLASIMRTMAEHHGCIFEFCRPSDTAKRICEILGVEYT